MKMLFKRTEQKSARTPSPVVILVIPEMDRYGSNEREDYTAIKRSRTGKGESAVARDDHVHRETSKRNNRANRLRREGED